MDVTAVIPTRDRPELFGPAVRSVLANTYPSFEVVVIDQSADERTADLVRELQTEHPNLAYVRSRQPGAAGARNLGFRHGRGAILAYTDDDCVVPLGWIASIVGAFQADPEADMLYGQVQAPAELAQQAHDVPTLPISESVRWVGRQDRFQLYGMSANLGVRRRLFETIGGFDEMMGVGGPLSSGEDFDLQYRAWRAGAVVLLRPEVTVDHFGLRTQEQWPATLRRYGLGDGAFYAKHVRCGDLLLLRLMLGTLLRLLVREVLHWTGLRRRWSRAVYLRACFEGGLRSLRYAVDRHSRLYVPQALPTRSIDVGTR